MLAAVAVIGTTLAANAQGESCTGCTAETFDYCSTPVTVSLANTLEMDCDNCDELQACANSISEWANGITLGNASFSVASTRGYSVYAGLSSGQMTRQGGGSPIAIGTGANQIAIKGKLMTNNTGGSAANNFGVTHQNLVPKTNNTAAGAGSKFISAATASLTYKSASMNIKTGPLPLNVANGDYKVNVVFTAIQD